MPVYHGPGEQTDISHFYYIVGLKTVFDKTILMDHIEDALVKIEKMVEASGNANDLTYFRFHRIRFRIMAETVLRVCRPGGTVLDIGSHFLHSSLLLSLLGFKVVSMDVEAFWEIDYIQQRANDNSLTPIIENNLEKMSSIATEHNKFDLVLFTEIFEHITFNPISFWKKIHRVIKDNGIIYLTTPNSLTIFGIARTLFNAIRLKGIGIGVNPILRTVTYGHHWKEYSATEIKEYFNQLNDGFSVSLRKFHYQLYAPQTSFKGKCWIGIMKMSNSIPFFKDSIEAVITVNKAYPWKIDTPTY